MNIIVMIFNLYLSNIKYIKNKTKTITKTNMNNTFQY